MKRTSLNQKIEIWGGIECTLNRVSDAYFDQLEFSGHYQREEDLDLIAALAIKKMRYPILWEKHQPQQNMHIDWSITEKKLRRLQELNIDIIAGLVHHGSGPRYANILQENFAPALAEYAKKVAQKFPWIEYYTPINEPLTTARFCGLYGIWHPHKKDDQSFVQILINECKATVLAMQAIRQINPKAKLIQTEDLGKTYSTPLLQYQADFENQRRWLPFDLLAGKVKPGHPLWSYLLFAGAKEEDLFYFLQHPCPPDIIGFNHYLTSERYLDENLQDYPAHTHGANFNHQYADVEAVRVNFSETGGIRGLLKEAWDYFQIPMAITEAHLHCTREEQLRWLNFIWQSANELQKEEVRIIAITAWALLGSYGWNNLLTHPNGEYESGIFDVRSGRPRATLLSKLIQSYALETPFDHPVLKNQGWWHSNRRIIYPYPKNEYEAHNLQTAVPALLITGKTGTLGQAFSKICVARGISHQLLSRQELNIEDLQQIEQVIKERKPWAIINTAGFVRVDEAEENAEHCFLANATGPENLALVCRKYGVKLLTFSSDLVFDGKKNQPYLESDAVAPLNIYGQSKAQAERTVLQIDPSALIIRTSAFFGPWDQYNFATHVLSALHQHQPFAAADDICISPTYIPDLVHSSLDLLLDNESGVWNLANYGEVSWADFARRIADMGGYSLQLINPVSIEELGLKAVRPMYSVLKSEKGILLSPLENALSRYLADQELVAR
ncbi:MAG TPA: dTDP-4-dehydrorhamnose reductase [Daejeonella sp.]|nr:dTDP-4-dehydrorhamnose reductase [Daejeonella sp.]